jgi:hypothetical protein
MANTRIHWSELDQKFWIATDEEPLWFESLLEAKDAVRRSNASEQRIYNSDYG